MIELLVTILILCVVGWLLFYGIGLLPIAQPFKNIILAIIVIIMALYLLGYAPPLFHR